MDKPGADRPAKPSQLLARLAELGIAVDTHHHAPVFTVAEAKALRGELPGAHTKNLFLKDKKGGLWLLVALEDRAIDLKTLRHRIGSAPLSFAGADLLRQVLGVEPGSVTPFALINDIAKRTTVILDAGMMTRDILNVHPLTNSATTAIRSLDLLTFIASCGHEVSIVEL